MHSHPNAFLQVGSVPRHASSRHHTKLQSDSLSDTLRVLIIIIWLLHNPVEASFDLFRYLLLGVLLCYVIVKVHSQILEGSCEQ